MPMNTVRLPRGAWRYDPDQPLGEPGGFGAVFVGLDENGEEIAVKRLHISATQAAHRELRIAEELFDRDLSNVIPILDAGQDAESDAYYVVMARAERDLQDAIYAGDISGEASAAAIMTNIVHGLQDVPDIVHRDLKPRNILFHEGRWKIADFGIARFIEAATSANTLKEALTPHYAAPEQWRGERVTTATDVYALGCIGYDLLSGHPPFEGPNTEDFQEQHLDQTPRPIAGVSARLRTLLAMMLRKEPLSRPSLKRVLQQLEIFGKDSSPLEGAQKLGEVGAVIAESKSQEEATEQAERAAKERRERHATAALKILDDLSNKLFRRIAEGTVEATRVSRPYPANWNTRSNVTDSISLGGAQLTLGIYGEALHGMFLQSGWDVLAGGFIRVEYVGRSYSRGASLWYTTLGKEADDYRWYEVCYMLSPFSSKQRDDQLFALPPGEEADLAASTGMTEYQFGAKPEPIDDEDFTVFCDRWMGLLANAAAGKLDHLRSLPLD